MPVSLESEIDALYQLPLTDFTAARNGLAKRIGGDEGKRVKALVKPTAVPRIVNQLYWEARPVYERLLKAGSDLRRTQIAALGGRRPDNGALLAKATAAHQKALAEAVQRAAGLGTRAGDVFERSATDDLTRMLEAVSLAPKHPETRGRLTAWVQPAGFEVLAGVTPALAIVRPAAASLHRTTVNRAPVVRVRREPPSVELARKERARQRLEEQTRRKQDAAVATASRVLAKALAAETRAKAAVDSAYEELARVRDDRRTAEQALRRLKR